MSKVKKRAEELLACWVEKELLRPDGGLRGPAGRPPIGASGLAPWAGLLAAYLVTGRSEDGRYHGSGALVRFAWDVLARGCRGVDVRSRGGVESSHFALAPLYETYELLRPLASAGRRRRFDDKFLGFTSQLAEATRPKLRAHGMNDTALGTGLNHVLSWSALLWQGGALFGRKSWQRLALRFAQRVAEAQHPSGYVSENEGPSVGYDAVTLNALGKLYFRSGEEKVGEYTRNLARLLVHCVYPNLRSVETFDERGRGRALFAGGLVGFQTIPEGRRLLERVVDRAWDDVEAGDSPRHLLAPLATALLYLRPGAKRLLPCERKSALFRADGKALIRRRAPWFYVLSAFGNPPPTHNVFFHERTSIMSIYHDHVGRIVGGGNDRAPEYAAFSCHESNWIYYCIPRSGAVHAGRSADTLALDYGAADLTVKVRLLSRNRLVLTVENDLRERRDKCFLNLQLPLEGVKRVSLGTKKAVTLKGRRKLRHHKSAGLLDAGCWRIEAPPDSVFVWPHHPYVPYPRRVRSAESVGFLRIPLAPVRNAAEVRITVKS